MEMLETLIEELVCKCGGEWLKVVVDCFLTQ